MFSHAHDTQETAAFLNRAIAHNGWFGSVRILDFGCGPGALVKELTALGHDVYGCDVSSSSGARLRQIETPYRLPFDDSSFDVVVSTSVLEHAQNQDEYMREISRVLRPGGLAMHIMPGKWYLPSEPHIYVPLVNFFWPRCPEWWFYLWALLGCRNEFQHGISWREVARSNISYSRSGIIYVPASKYEKISRRYFTDCKWQMNFFLKHSHGGMASIARRFPLFPLWEIISREFRMGFLVQRK